MWKNSEGFKNLEMYNAAVIKGKKSTTGNNE